MKREDTSEFEQEVLKRLDKYSEMLLDKKNYEKLKQKKTKKNEVDLLDHSESLTLEHFSKNKKKRKKKKGKWKDEEKLNIKTQDKVVNQKTKKTGEQRYLMELKLEMELDKSESKLFNKSENKKSDRGVSRKSGLSGVYSDDGTDGLNKNERVVTVYDEHLKKQATKRKAPEIVVFEDPGKRKKKEIVKSQTTEDTSTKEDQPEFDLKKARYEVQKFGIKGFHGNEKDEAMTALLIKLGAKPPKNKYLNYKEYQEIKKKQKESEKDKREMDRGLGYKVVNPNKNRKRQKDKNDIGFVDGQVGKFKSGVQFVRKKELVGFDKKERHKR